MKEAYIETKGKLPKELSNVTFEYKYDIASFFNYLSNGLIFNSNEIPHSAPLHSE